MHSSTSASSSLSSSSSPSLRPSSPRESEDEETVTVRRNAKRARFSDRQQSTQQHQQLTVRQQQEQSRTACTDNVNSLLTEYSAVHTSSSASTNASNDAETSLAFSDLHSIPTLSSHSSSSSSLPSLPSLTLLTPLSLNLTRCRSLQEFIGFSDLLFHCFGFLHLKELTLLFRSSRTLSTCYFRYRFQPYHEVDADSFLCALSACEKRRQRHVSSSLSTSSCPPSDAALSFMSSVSSAWSASTFSLLSQSRQENLRRLRVYTLINVSTANDLRKLSDLPMFQSVCSLKLKNDHGRDGNFSGDLAPENLPHSLTALNTGALRQIGVGVLPSSVTLLTLESVDQDFDVNVFPMNLRELQLPAQKKSLRAGCLPAALRRLDLRYYRLGSDSPLDIFPTALEELKVGWCADMSLDFLPPNLRCLRLRMPMSVMPMGTLPKKVAKLELTGGEKLDWLFPRDFFPSSLRQLTLPKKLKNCKLEAGVLPLGLEVLTMGEYAFPIEGHTFPPTLLSLDFIGCYEHPLQSNFLPASLRSLTLRILWPEHKIVFPTELEELSLDDYGRSSQVSSQVRITFLPGDLSQRLRRFTVHSGKWRISFTQNCLPNSLRYLHLRLAYTFQLDCGMLNEGLEECLLHAYTQAFDLSRVVLPQSIRSLTVEITESVFPAVTWPSCMTKLTIINYDQFLDTLPRVRLPESLRAICFMVRFSKASMITEWIPKNLNELFLWDAHMRGSDQSERDKISKQQQDEDEQIRMSMPNTGIIRV